MSMPEPVSPRGGWTRRVVLALLPASWAAVVMAPARAEAPVELAPPLPRPDRGEVFEAGVFEDDVFE